MHDDRTVLEFVPDGANMKRLIYMGGRVGGSAIAAAPATATATAPATTVTTVTTQQFYVQKDADMGPDVYAIYSAAAGAGHEGPKRHGLALVRTLAVSRALRTGIKAKDKLFVRAEFNKTFDKYEVLEVYEKNVGAA
jgi:hypothetical protein